MDEVRRRENALWDEGEIKGGRREDVLTRGGDRTLLSQTFCLIHGYG